MSCCLAVAGWKRCAWTLSEGFIEREAGVNQEKTTKTEERSLLSSMVLSIVNYVLLPRYRIARRSLDGCAALEAHRSCSTRTPHLGNTGRRRRSRQVDTVHIMPHHGVHAPFPLPGEERGCDAHVVLQHLEYGHLQLVDAPEGTTPDLAEVAVPPSHARTKDTKQTQKYAAATPQQPSATKGTSTSDVRSSSA